MKFTAKKEDILRAVNIASRLSSTRATLPILQNLYLETGKNMLLVRATDLEQTVDIEVRGEVEEPGKLTIPARLMVDYLQHNTDQEVIFETNDTTLKIRSVNHRAQIKGLPAEEYPTVPEVKADASITLPSSDVIKAIEKTIFASASDEMRPILNSLLWRFKDKTLTIVGTDGYRLALATVVTERDFTGDYVLPKRTMQELTKILGAEVEMMFAGNQVKFISDGVRLTSRLIEGSYPSYEGIIPKKTKQEITIAGPSLLQALRLASLFSRDSAYSTKLTVNKTTMTIQAISPQLGENTNEITLENPVEEPITISLNAQYLIDALTAMSRDVRIGLIDAKSPLTLREGENNNYLYLLMPLRSES